ncbi:hypothetical protein MYSTI_01927 [Myxococcus stipitatus DSM 14675]|uniref:DUF2635 domain-containing protein n=1 Tax=Myxococcus stipitatus (strain DSM 14675 / JCM 12634 / Mx s8) TaxID=1278073 RepID=L7U539_MYXSD|nr:hypothetical protein MYSTI_01927 [Myxococcus stipitatus DSM 14675]
MFVKPKPGALVRDPVTRQPLPVEGREVPENSFWLRRLAVGDVLPNQNTDRVLAEPEEGEQ